MCDAETSKQCAVLLPPFAVSCAAPCVLLAVVILYLMNVCDPTIGCDAIVSQKLSASISISLFRFVFFWFVAVSLLRAPAKIRATRFGRSECNAFDAHEMRRRNFYRKFSINTHFKMGTHRTNRLIHCVFFISPIRKPVYIALDGHCYSFFCFFFSHRI